MKMKSASIFRNNLVQDQLLFFGYRHRFTFEQISKQFTIFSASLGKYCSFCWGVPYFLNSVTIKVFWTSHITLTAGSILASSSTTRQDIKNDEAVPPYSASTSIPINWKNKESNINQFKDWHSLGWWGVHHCHILLIIIPRSGRVY